MMIRLRVKVRVSRDERSDDLLVSVIPRLVTKANIQKTTNELLDVLELKLDDSIQRRSGWVENEIKQLYCDSFAIRPIRGASYTPTPDKYSNSRCGLINTRNTD